MSRVNNKHSRAIITGLSIVLSIFLVIGLSGYFIMKSYISKMRTGTDGEYPPMIRILS